MAIDSDRAAAYRTDCVRMIRSMVKTSGAHPIFVGLRRMEITKVPFSPGGNPSLTQVVLEFEPNDSTEIVVTARVVNGEDVEVLRYVEQSV